MTSQSTKMAEIKGRCKSNFWTFTFFFLLPMKEVEMSKYIFDKLKTICCNIKWRFPFTSNIAISISSSPAVWTLFEFTI